MNLNYIGSVAERFMQFRSSLAAEEGVATDIFNCISIYMPKSLGAANLVDAAWNPAEITATAYAVLPVTVDNYRDVFKDTGALMAQWLPAFNDGTNFNMTLYIIIFDDTGFTPTVTATGITWAPLKKAFDELYFISFFKTVFSEHYDGSEVTHDPAEAGDYSDANYFDMALSLSALCEAESTLSMAILYTKVTVPDVGGADSNLCKVLSQTRGTETTQAATFTGSTVTTRAQYFWGFINLLGGKHTWLIVHNGVYMPAYIIGKWFEAKNGSGEFIGNKLDKIRLTGTNVKPTGNPSPLNSDVNLNLDKSFYVNLDEKYVTYFISISGASDNDVEAKGSRSVANYPVNAYAMSKWIDFNASQDMANFVTARGTLTDPVLANQQAYSDMQSILAARISAMADTRRLYGTQMNFPPFSEAKKGNWFEGTAVWSGYYDDDLEGVRVSGSIVF